MNLYFWLIIVVSIMIMISGFVRGYHRGFVKELEGLVAAIFAVISLVLISGLVRGTIGENVSAKARNEATALTARNKMSVQKPEIKQLH